MTIVTEYARTLIRVKAKQCCPAPRFLVGRTRRMSNRTWCCTCSARLSTSTRSAASLNTFIARVVDSGVAMLVRDRDREKRIAPSDAELQSLEDKVRAAGRSAGAAVDDHCSRDDLERRTGTASLTDAELFELVDDVASVMRIAAAGVAEHLPLLAEPQPVETETELGI